MEDASAGSTNPGNRALLPMASGLKASKVYTRRSSDWTNRLRKIAEDAWHISAGSAIIDGEVVVPSADGGTVTSRCCRTNCATPLARSSSSRSTPCITDDEWLSLSKVRALLGYVQFVPGHLAGIAASWSRRRPRAVNMAQRPWPIRATPDEAKIQNAPGNCKIELTQWIRDDPS